MSIPVTEKIPRHGRGTRPDPDAAPTAGTTAAWPDIERLLRSGSGTTWLSVRAADYVHTRPVFAAWTGRVFVFASNAGAAKTAHLDRRRQRLARHRPVDSAPGR